MTTMLSGLCAAAILTVSLASQAQTASVKDIPTDGESTTITVQKGPAKAAGPVASEILEGSAEIAGDPNPMEKAARKSWKTACDDWRKDVKEMNKDNIVLILDCNSAKCEVEGHMRTCKSIATYKIRLKLQH